MYMFHQNKFLPKAILQQLRAELSLVLKSVLHVVFSWLCLLEREIVPVLSVLFFTSCISVFHQAAITGYSYTGQALLS